MLSGTEQAVERRNQSHDLIQDLISTRTEMLALYTRLAAKKPFTDDGSVGGLLQEFCEILVDYTASAHFRLYRFLDEKTERRRAVIETAHGIYPRIVQTTRAIVDFNDRYETFENFAPPELERDLSWLGERLAERIELEDQLVEVLTTRRAVWRQEGLDS